MTKMEVDKEPSLVDDVKAKENEPNSDDDDEDFQTQARKALFSAVEEASQTDDEDGVHSFRPLMQLFNPSRNHPIKPGATAREIKDLILDTMGSFHKGYARRFFAALKPIVQRVVDEEEYVPDSAFKDDDGNETAESTPFMPEEITPDEKSTQALKFLLQVTQFLQTYLEALADKQMTNSRRKSHAGQTISVVSEAFEVAQPLHEILISLHGCGPEALPVQSAILTLCETWWLSNGSQRDGLIPNALVLLVLKALGVDGKEAQKADIKRLLKMQDAFHEIDFSDHSSDLRSFLLKVVSSPLCLKLSEGKRFISGLFLLDPSLVSDLHQAIRIQIPQSKKPILKTYGEIYKKAWKDAHSDNCAEEIQTAIEEEILQDLMYSALHISNLRMSKILLLVLEPFHEGKKSTEFEALLHRMYGPILWRALSAANPQVRINAARILGEVFPLQEPSHVNAEADFKRGAKAIKGLLKDKDPKVRVAASETAAKVLGTYWDVLHTDSIRSLLSIIVTKHASDVTSYHVRAAALHAVTALLDTPQCHAVLRELLPIMGNLIHDKNKNVRLAAVNMLLKVKTVENIKFFHVVPVDHLKARLADEGRLSSLNSEAYNPMMYRSPVASALTRLLQNSFVPQGSDVTASDQIRRTLSFLKTDPDAAAVFYANLADHLPPKAIAKLAAMLLRCIVAAIENEKKKSKEEFSKKRSRNDSRSDDGSQESESESEGEGEEEVDLRASNTSFMASLVETIATLWESILEELEYDENEGCQQFLVKAFAGNTLTELLRYFERAAEADKRKSKSTLNDYRRIRSAFLRTAGFLDPKDLEGFVPYITRSLQAISHKESAKISTASTADHFALLCLWGMAEDVATSLSASIVAAIDESDDVSLPTPFSDDSKKRKNSTGGRKSSTDSCVVPTLSPEVALNVLNELLLGSDPGNAIARETLIANTKAREKLEGAFEAATQYTGRFLRAAPTQSQTVNDGHFEFLVQVCEAFGRFSLHKAGFSALENNAMIELNLEAKHLLEWTSGNVLPAIRTEGKGIDLQELELSRISFVNDSMVSMELDKTLDAQSPLAPARKKGNRNATPERLDGPFGLAGPADVKRKDSRIIPGHNTAALVRCASSTLLQNACLIFSEWLSAGSGSGEKQILEAALQWISILDQKYSTNENTEDKENGTGNSVVPAHILLLLPAFARLSVALGVTASNFELMKSMLRKLPRIFDSVEDNNEVIEQIEGLVQDMVSSALKSNESAGVVSAVLESAYELLPTIKTGDISENDSATFVLPTTAFEVLCEVDYDASAATLASALHAISVHKRGSFLLAEKLVENLSSNLRFVQDADANTNPTILFEAKCLWLLADAGASRNSDQFEGILRKLKAIDRSNAVVFGDEKPIGAIFKHLLEAGDPKEDQGDAEEDQGEPKEQGNPMDSQGTQDLSVS